MLLGIGIATMIPAIIVLDNGVFPPISRAYLYGVPLTLISLGLGILEKNNSTNRALQFFIHPWFVWLGSASYVLYLVHNMILRIWDTVIPITPVQVPLITIAVIVVSAIGYKFWEEPMLRYMKTKMR